MRNRVKSIFPASIVAACLLLEMNVAGQAPEPGPPQATPAPTVERAPTKVIPNVPDDPTDGFSIGVFYWLPGGNASLLGGHQSVQPSVQTLPLSDFDKQAGGIRITTPAGKYNRIVISGFQSNSSGTTKATQDLNFFGNPFPTGDTLHTDYRVRNVKFTWDYLFYPAPPAAKIRYKALFEFQYVGTKTTIAAPLDLNATTAQGTRNIYRPTFGLGADIVPSKHFRLEVRGSGIAWPHSAYIADAEANAVVRESHIELAVGGRYYHFRTSPNSDEFFRGTMFGPMVSLRFLLGK
jgi:hypothetical protein